MSETLLKAPDLSDLEKFNGNKLLKAIHETIKYASEDIQSFGLNKAIARCREAYKRFRYMSNQEILPLVKYGYEILLQILNPFIPRCYRRIMGKTRHKQLLCETNWQKYDEKYLLQDKITLALGQW
jgi:leucyl-tRNA synthetase